MPHTAHIYSSSWELARSKLDIVGVQEVSWDREGILRTGVIILYMEKEMKIINWEHKFFVHHRIVSAVKRVEFVSERMSYTVLRGRRVNIFIINLYMLRSKIEKAQ